MEVASYDLFIDVDFPKLKFTGRSKITLRSEGNVVLNAVDLQILRVHAGGKDLQFSQSGEELVIESGAVNGILEVEYAGSVSDSLAGIYKASYDHTYVVTTHFEAAQARRMFPCVDRPDVKAEFRLAVRIDKNLDAISNMPVESVNPEGEKKTITFQKTPRMSTYLLYLGVGKFQEESRRFGKTEIILAATSGKAEQGRFAQEDAQKAIRYFESYFGIPFALPKLHLVGVPEFPMGAMENWGAIAFREERLLIDLNTGTKMKMLVSQSVAHEVAHQWFGDLVTMKWWDDIWLNESFATFMTYKAIDSYRPEWRVWENIFNGLPKAEALAEAMGRDSLENTHPVQVPVKSPDELDQIFDAISYGKGCHILRMIEAYVGAEAFRAGVRKYLSEHAYSNATGADFWSALQDASSKQVSKIMLQWVQQAGYPVVTVSLHGNLLKLQQERFLISGKSDQTKWPIPVIIEMNGQRKDILMEGLEETVECQGLQSLKINPDHTGFYSVRYIGLEEFVWRSKLTPFDKWGLIFDSFSFLLSGKTAFREYLAVLNKFKNETETLPAQEVSDQLALLYALAPSKIKEISKMFHSSFFDLLQKKTDENSSILRGTVAARLALVDETFASQMGGEFKKFASVQPDMREAVALGYARSTNDFDGITRGFKEANSDEDKSRFLDALACFTDPGLLRRALDFSLSGEVKKQDAFRVLLSSTANPQAKDVAFTWLQQNLERLHSYYKGSGILTGVLGHIIPILGVGRVQETETLFEQHKMPDAEMGINAGLEKLRAYDRLAKNISNA